MMFLMLAATITLHGHTGHFKVMERYFQGPSECRDQGEALGEQIVEKARRKGGTAKVFFDCFVGELRPS
jgi:hypothetical protein